MMQMKRLPEGLVCVTWPDDKDAGSKCLRSFGFKPHGQVFSVSGEIACTDDVFAPIRSAANLLEHSQCMQHGGLPGTILADQDRGWFDSKIHRKVLQAAEVVDVQPLNHGVSPVGIANRIVQALPLL